MGETRGEHIAIVGIIGDTHCPGMRKGYVEFLQRTFDAWGVNRVVHIGDLVDWHCLSYHEKNPMIHEGCKEVRDARKQIAELVAAFPEADWMIGNHDALPMRKAVTAGILPELLVSYNDFWQVDWQVHGRHTELKIDGVHYRHGDVMPGGQNAALKQAKNNFTSAVQGHHHTNGGVTYFANPDFRVFGLDVGCGIDAKRMQFEYGRPFKKKSVLGCGIVVNGTAAYFEPWLLKSR